MGFFDRFRKKKEEPQRNTDEKWQQLQYRNDDGTWENTDTKELDKVYRTVSYDNGVYSFSETEVL